MLKLHDRMVSYVVSTRFVSKVNAVLGFLEVEMKKVLVREGFLLKIERFTRKF